MALKILPSDVRSILCASAQIKNYKEAVEDLVYNSLDAEATSIAIRINIVENKIQVVDNGCGITKNDFGAIGQRYMTSKLSDVSSLKLVPKHYGYRGEFIANIIEISQYVKITSRHKDCEDTWAKNFHGNKNVNISKVATRPSKGTTVDINGFLYNLNIKKQEIDPINDLQNIKMFLEQLSVIHNHLSLSLRDDSKNEIIFQIHKKRDIYQTLSILFDIERTKVQELHVEKNQYKVKGLIGDTERENGRTWVYLNGKFIKNSKLHRTINEYFNKYLEIQDKSKLKSKKIHNEDHLFTKNNLFYFVFIKCPYIDYDINFTVKELVIEFKNWDQIKKLLEKLVRFYVGNIDLKDNNKTPTKIIKNHENKHNNPNRIKKIINDILGKNLKTLGTLQVQNGVKGKMIKRNNKNTRKTKQIMHIDSENRSIDKCLQQLRRKRRNDTAIQNKKMINREDEYNMIIKNKQHSKSLINIKETASLNIANKIFKTKKKKRKVIRNNHRTNKFEIIKEHNFNKIVKYNAENCMTSKSAFASKREYQKTALRYNVDFEKYNANSFKTTYDLLQTILATQKKTDGHDFKYIQSPSINHQKSVLSDIIRPSFKPKLQLQSYFAKEINANFSKEKDINNMSCIDVICSGFRCESSYCNSKLTNFDTTLKDSFVSKEPIVEHHSLGMRDIFMEYSDNISKKMGPLYYSSSNLTVTPLTYKSHHYGENTKNIIQRINKPQTIRFITNHSRDNFITNKKETKNIFKNKFTDKRNIKLLSHFGTQSKQINDKSCSLECTASNGHRSSLHPNFSMYYLDDNKSQSTHESNNFSVNLASGYGNTYTVSTQRTSCSFNTNKTSQSSFNSQVLSISDSVTKKKGHDFLNLSNDTKIQEQRNDNIILVSRTQHYAEVVSDQTIDPLNVCETVYLGRESIEKEFAYSFSKNDSFCDSWCKNVDNYCDYSNYEKKNGMRMKEPQNKNSDNVCHHFNNTLIIQGSKVIKDVETHLKEPVGSINIDKVINNEPNLQISQTNNLQCNRDIGKGSANISKSSFDFKTRLRFLPKGMSQIFNKYDTKTSCNYKLDADYYENILYYDFANHVQMQTEIYEPAVQNVENVTTKDINKLKNKIHKENLSLVFDELSLREALILNQVDGKFIASVIKQHPKVSSMSSEYLALFDQHAVHERITLENNLEGYLNEDKWRSIHVNNVVIKLSQDEILYLHNFTDKFKLLGLQWSILNNSEVIVNSIPEAILGKNPREVENVVKAVRNLIVEEIKIIQSQKGCITLYPKSIMDLVFSEACRYAIKFGDKLSKNDCIQLLKDLSNCKTPFQCAHGRPVMAVLVELKKDKHDYKINPDSLKKFKLNRFKPNIA